MNASDIMTRNVMTAAPDTSINEIATQMLTHHIGALPVMKDGKLVGIVSESDLLRRAETGTAAARPRWAEFFADASSLATHYIKSHGRKAAPAAVPRPGTEGRQAAAAFEHFFGVAPPREHDAELRARLTS